MVPTPAATEVAYNARRNPFFTFRSNCYEPRKRYLEQRLKTSPIQAPKSKRLLQADELDCWCSAIDGKRFVVQADEILTAFLEVEPVVWRGLNAREPIVAQTVTRLSRRNATMKGKFAPKARLQLCNSLHATPLRLPPASLGFMRMR